jgi:adenylate cyclase
LKIKDEVESPKSISTQKVNIQDYSDVITLINSLLESEQLFLDSDLSLRKMADKVNLHPNRLSQIINEHYQCNFNELINQYRVDYFCKISTDQKFEHLTILGKAFESGFNSKTVFNSFSRKK